jgi:hypothetical protein
MLENALLRRLVKRVWIVGSVAEFEAQLCPWNRQPNYLQMAPGDTERFILKVAVVLTPDFTDSTDGQGRNGGFHHGRPLTSHACGDSWPSPCVPVSSEICGSNGLSQVHW